MKEFILLIFVFFVMPLSGTAQNVIAYTYDDAGNRTARTSSSIEVAVCEESTTDEETNIADLNFNQLYGKGNNILISLFVPKSERRYCNGLFDVSHLRDRIQFVLNPWESTAIIAQEINAKRNLTSICRNPELTILNLPSTYEIPQ